MIIDWKAHILPGLDRKCDSHVKAIQLMIYAKRAGVDKLVAMPFYEAGTDLRQFIEMRDDKLRLTKLGFQSVVDLSEIRHSKDIKKLLPFVESGFVRGFGGDKLAGHDPYRHLEKTKRRMGECFEKLCKKHC